MALDFQLKPLDPNAAGHDCVVVGIFADNGLSPAAQALDAASGGRLAALVARGDVSGKAGTTSLLPDLPGIKSAAGADGRPGRSAQSSRCRSTSRPSPIPSGRLRTGPVKNALLTLTELPVKGRDMGWNVRQAVISADHAAYEYTATRSKPAEVTLATIAVTAEPAHEAELQRGVAICRRRADWRARWATCRRISATRATWPNSR